MQIQIRNNTNINVTFVSNDTCYTTLNHTHIKDTCLFTNTNDKFDIQILSLQLYLMI